MKNIWILGCLAAFAIPVHAAPAIAPSGYHLAQTVPLPGDEGWDDLAIHQPSHRLFVTHGTHVVAVDLAGNASPVSNITCISVVPTTGFWGVYKDSGGTVQPGCACSLPGQPRNNPLTVAAVWPVALALLGLVARTRRRRS